MQQRHQAAALIQGNQVVATADMGVTDEDLRDRAPAGQLHHALPCTGIGVHTHLVDGLHAALFQQALGPNTERADLGGVHQHGAHCGPGIKLGSELSQAPAGRATARRHDPASCG
jgi:hypothetical protein